MFGNSEKTVIGYDLSEEYVQISYSRFNDDMPMTWALTEGSEQYNIPACLFKRAGINQWFFGIEAENYERAEEGMMVRGLLVKALEGEEVELLGDFFNPVALLALFVKRSLSLLTGTVRKEKIAGIMFTVPNLDSRAVETLKEMVLLLDMPDCCMYFQTREESIYHYILHQPAQLWNHDVLVYDLSGEYLKSFYFQRNEKTTPQVVFIERGLYKNVTGSQKRDQDFLEVIQKETEGKIVSCAYLLGDGFMENWCEESLKELCRKRRAFKGNNLYSRGACYAMLEKEEEPGKGRKIIFLGKDKLKANVGMNVRRGQADSYLALLNGGDNWYESRREWDVILAEKNSFQLIITPLDGKNVKNVEIVLDGLAVREERTTRLHLEIFMEQEDILKIRATDMGFGELVPGTGQVFEQQIQLT